jgi:putative hemolysin
LPSWSRRIGPYECRLASSPEDLVAVQRLRFDVFNRELGEGLASSELTARDEDAFDAVSHHLMVFHCESREVVGTYRLLTRELVQDAGFYSDVEFDLSPLPVEVLDQGIELGRACVARDHRGQRILQLLWSGIAAYLIHNKKRFCFGCASIPEAGDAEVAATTAILREGGNLHASIRVEPREDFAVRVAPPNGEGQVPSLLRAYLSLGARVCGTPARDREFGTIDYFVLIDVEDVKPAVLSKLTAS